MLVQGEEEERARKRARVTSPTPSDAASEETLPAVACAPCDEQDARSFACAQPGCTYEAKQANALVRHQASKHGLGIVWHACDQPGCSYKGKRADHLKQHQASKHGIGVVWHACDQPNCEAKFKRAGQLKQHKADKHSGERPFACDQPNCKAKFKQASTLTQHKAHVHDLGVVWHACDQPGCEYKAKQASDLKQHKADAHDLGVTWHACDQPNCEAVFKRRSTLCEHMKRHHARVYAQRKKQQEERVRRALLDAGWQEHCLAETMPPVGFFRREKRINFKCAKLESRDTWANIDFVLGVPNGFVFLEVDEDQHKYGYGDHLSCDMKRMACVMESLAAETDYNVPNLYWLRYNPNAWYVGCKTRPMLKVDREANLVKWLEAFECVAPFGIGYAFYDCEAPDERNMPGALDVLGNPEYNREYAEMVDNLMDMA